MLIASTEMLPTSMRLETAEDVPPQALEIVAVNVTVPLVIFVKLTCEPVPIIETIPEGNAVQLILSGVGLHVVIE